MQAISRDDVGRMMRTTPDLTIVEVLGKQAFGEYHIPGAINVPIGEGFDERIQAAVPNKTAPVIVYCWDTDCDASPKAAERMEQLGYDAVFDYEAGKADWKQADLPVD